MKGNQFETLGEILIALGEGKKIRHLNYLDDEYIHVLHGQIEEAEGISWETEINDEFDQPSEWSLYQPPKKKVKLAPALYRDCYTKQYILTYVQFKSEKDAMNYSLHEFVKWPVGPFIEIEEESK
jgi:hypothetical protein